MIAASDMLTRKLLTQPHALEDNYEIKNKSWLSLKA
jgi:hypothetical protein